MNFNSDGIFVCVFFFLTHAFWILKGKGASLGVGRGRAVAMRAKVSPLHLIFVHLLFISWTHFESFCNQCALCMCLKCLVDVILQAKTECVTENFVHLSISKN